MSTARHGDPYADAAALGWNIVDASTLDADRTFACDVVIVGTGAGGATVAEILAEAGLKVVMVEEGPLRTSADFRMRESEAYPDLYHESAARKTRDKAINILQGRCVGGGTTVNWTSSFRTPATTLAFWAREYGLAGFGADDLVPWFERAEARLSIAPWSVAPNPNNDALARGAAALGLRTAAISRNVKACWDLGYCGMGCPVNAKQSMLVTSVPGALARGATLLTRLRAEAFEARRDSIARLRCSALDAHGVNATRRTVTIEAKTFVAAAGAIGTPALLLRSRLPDPHGLVGKRTFLHPVLVSAALMPDKVEAYFGAPQSVYCDEFLERFPVDGPMGYKLEAPPVHPVLAATTLPNHGALHATWMRELPRMQVLLALLRDGFHSESPGGTVSLRDDGSPVLDYPFTGYIWEGARRALASMAEIQFAAGAKRVMPVHGDGAAYASWPEAREAIRGFALAPLRTTVVSAHVMGGCPFGPDVRRAVANPTGRHHHLDNLYIADGSLFPTSIGANPQLSIYAVAARIAHAIARESAGPAPTHGRPKAALPPLGEVVAKRPEGGGLA